jgi:hypothetical protein
MKPPSTLLRAGALAAIVLFCIPGMLAGFTLSGESLPLDAGNYQRDVRVFNNFADAAANDNATPNASFPGAVGAPLAIWKAAAAWNSNVAGRGKNFDFDWQGAATAIGSTNDNVVSSLRNTCGGGTLAYTEGPINDGWRIRFCEEWTWSDGPGSPVSTQVDIQGVATHELGHALGLLHAQAGFCSGSCVGVSTMCPAICSNGVTERTIEVDDANGVEAIYGAIQADKPLITALSGSFVQGETLVIEGTAFAPTVHVKFTAGTTQNSGAIPGVVVNVPSSAGGTQVSVVIPLEARSGNVLVWEPSQSRLSNPFPINVTLAVPAITSVTPSTGPLRGGNTVDVVGTNFASNATVEFDGVTATVLSRTGSTQISVRVPSGSAEGQMADVTVTQSGTSGTAVDAYTYGPNPVELTYSGSTVIGQPLTFTIYGPANKRAALAVGPEGTFTHAGTGLTFCFRTPLDFRRQFNQLPLGPLGQASATWTVTGAALSRKTAQGVVQIVPGSEFAQTNCITMTIFP